MLNKCKIQKSIVQKNDLIIEIKVLVEKLEKLI